MLFDYVICTPERKQKTCVCHINMLKSYLSQVPSTELKSSVIPISHVAVLHSYCSSEDNLNVQSVPVPGVRLQNSTALRFLENYLSDLPASHREDVIQLIHSYVEYTY